MKHDFQQYKSGFMEENIVLNSCKCHFLTFGFKEYLPDFSCENIATRNVCEGKILDVTIDSKINSKSH